LVTTKEDARGLALAADGKSNKGGSYKKFRESAIIAACTATRD
jgi:hypothetical protein